MKRDLYKIFS